MTAFVLLNGVSSNTNGTPVSPNGSEGVIQVSATSFGGGTVSVQLSGDNGTTWETITYQNAPMAFTSNDVKLMRKAPVGMLLRAILTGASGASNVFVRFFE